MISLNLLLILSGLLQIFIALLATSVPKLLEWDKELESLSLFMRRLVWVYGSFIFITVISLGVVSVFFADTLVNGEMLSKAICCFIGVFWLMRFFVALFVFPEPKFTKNRFFKFGYKGLTFGFVFLAIVNLYVFFAT